MTVQELYEELEKCIQQGWANRPIYLCDGWIVDEVTKVDDYPLGDPANPNCIYESILMIK